MDPIAALQLAADVLAWPLLAAALGAVVVLLRDLLTSLR
jgi:hypothetical protein